MAWIEARCRCRQDTSGEEAKKVQENNEVADPQWGLEDWLHSVRTRMAMIRRRGDTLCELVEKACQALWPDEPSPENL